MRIVLLALIAWSAPAHADPAPLTIHTELGDWATTVDELRKNGGRAVHVEAHDENGQVPCDDYRLALDEAGSRAFVLGECDPVRQTIELRLIDRHFLFTRVENITQPILPTLTASRPPAPPPPFVSETCWAVIGPSVIDPESGERKTIAPERLALTVEPIAAHAQAIAFDHAWLVRVPKRAGIDQVRYALVPWHSESASKSGLRMELETPPGIVSTPLPLRCQGDPLGPLATRAVPNRLETIDVNGAPITLRRRQSDAGLIAQAIFGPAAVTLGVVGTLLAGIPMTAAGDGPREHWHQRDVGVGVLVAGTALIAVGGYLTYSELRRRALRRGTETVSPRLAFHPESASLSF